MVVVVVEEVEEEVVEPSAEAEAEESPEPSRRNQVAEVQALAPDNSHHLSRTRPGQPPRQ